MLKTRKKIRKLIRQYVKAVNLKDTKYVKAEDIVERTFNSGDIQEKKRFLIAMRATIFAKKNIQPGLSVEEQQKIMDEFTKTEDLTDVKWPKLKIKNDEKKDIRTSNN